MASLELNGKIYTVTPLTAKLGLRTAIRVGKMLGPAFTRLTDKSVQKNSLASAEGAAVIAQAFADMDDPHLEETLDVLMNTVEENGKPYGERWQTEMSGKLASLTQIIFFAIKTHFGDFMTAFATPQSSQSDAKAQAKSPPKS